MTRRTFSLSPPRPDSPPNRDDVSTGVRIGWVVRVGLVVWATFLCLGFLLAASLSPNPIGWGTHRQLGLPPCSIRVLLGIPCPYCGMTTSFAHFVRGQFPSSLSANIGGFGLATICVIAIPWSIASAIRGELWHVRRPDIAAIVVLGTVLGLSLLQWTARLL